MSVKNSFLGKGWQFPVKVNPATGRIMISSDEDDIKEAIQIILQTSKGERLMRPEFGCGIHEFNFDLIEDATLRLMESTIKDALRIWEPRVHEVSVQSILDEKDSGILHIHISYVVRSTNNLFNMVYPFYIHEGSK